MGTAITITEVYNAVMMVKEVVDTLQESELTQEAIDVIESFGDISDKPNNDVELLLTDIKNSLVSQETNETVLQRLDTIDERLNAEFITVNDCLGLIATTLLSYFSFKFITWLYNLISR